MPVIGGYRESPPLRYEPNFRLQEISVAENIPIDEATLNYLLKRALARECRLTREEYWYRAEALRECELGPNWWRRGHP